MVFLISFILGILFLVLSFFAVGLAGLIVFILGFLILGFSIGWGIHSRLVT